ncbi:MAG: quinolinate synthase NadA [Actinomycetota bacterium]|nr:quinolinate synthase NadA [Actinomycetota bacterium]
MADLKTSVGEISEVEEVPDETVAEQILKLKRERNALIFVHNYQRPEIHRIADFVGDSLDLSRKAAEADADVIVFCGVHFMAETAFILSPEKIVLLPDMRAGCPMANMVSQDDVRMLRKKHPDAVVVSYVNTTAAVKAESDYCCTSANAGDVVRAVEGEEVLFFPDRNLASYVARNVEKKIIPWQGFCPTHEQITREQIVEVMQLHAGAEVIAHPECTEEVLNIAHHIKSTSGMVDAAMKSNATEFIVATESGMIYPLECAVPEKRFYPPSREPICSDMKLITLSKVLYALQTLEPRVVVPEDIRIKAFGAVERMLEL